MAPVFRPGPSLCFLYDSFTGGRHRSVAVASRVAEICRSVGCETVLTHTQKVSRYLGCFQMTFQRHYIVDSYTYAVRRFSEHAEVKVVIPFGIKLNAEQLQLLNLLNMDEQQINKFRLKRLQGSVDLNTIYQRQNDQVYTLEKNMICDMHIVGSKKTEIPLLFKTTQRVTGLETTDVQPLTRSQITRRVKREIVDIY